MQIILTTNVKWSLSINQLICENTQTPNINFIVITLVLYDLRWNVNWSSTKWISWLLTLSGPTKITYFGNVSMEDNVLSFNVSVNDVHLMKVTNSTAYLSDDGFNIILWKWALFLNFFIKISWATKFHKEINCFLSGESWVEFDDVWMIKFEMNFHFFDKTLLVDFSDQFFLLYFFQSEDRTSSDMPYDVDSTKRSLSTEVENLKIADLQRTEFLILLIIWWMKFLKLSEIHQWFNFIILGWNSLDRILVIIILLVLRVLNR